MILSFDVFVVEILVVAKFVMHLDSNILIVSSSLVILIYLASEVKTLFKNTFTRHISTRYPQPAHQHWSRQVPLW